MTIKNLYILYILFLNNGNMTEAAKTLKMSQPNISLVVSALEKEFQRKILGKKGSTVFLLPDIVDLMDKVKNILTSYNSLFVNNELLFKTSRVLRFRKKYVIVKKAHPRYYRGRR